MTNQCVRAPLVILQTWEMLKQISLQNLPVQHIFFGELLSNPKILLPLLFLFPLFYCYLYLIVSFFYASRGSISGEFGRAMVRIPMARPNEPDMPPKRTKKVRLGIYSAQTQQKSEKFLFCVNFNGLLLVLDKIALFKPCLPGT